MNQLRLRGFYQDEKAKESDFKISRLEDLFAGYFVIMAVPTY